LGNLGSPGELNLPYFHIFNSKNVIVSKTLNNNENIRPCLAVQKNRDYYFISNRFIVKKLSINKSVPEFLGISLKSK
jgi:hypothetical protein